MGSGPGAVRHGPGHGCGGSWRSSPWRSYQGLGNPLGEANALCDLGRLRFRLRDYPAATRLLEQSLAIYQRLGELHGQAMGFHDLALVAHEEGRHRAAVGLLTQAMEIYRRRSALLRQALAHRDLAARGAPRETCRRRRTPSSRPWSSSTAGATTARGRDHRRARRPADDPQAVPALRTRTAGRLCRSCVLLDTSAWCTCCAVRGQGGLGGSDPGPCPGHPDLAPVDEPGSVTRRGTEPQWVPVTPVVPHRDAGAFRGLL
ncbi:tetratricopeptide repeat protein [Streptacidiphilus sp. 4-A2]|nr:tetratricopeptide repeat protein [Streptacidiphilus sp. 4-A2]